MLDSFYSISKHGTIFFFLGGGGEGGGRSRGQRQSFEGQKNKLV